MPKEWSNVTETLTAINAAGSPVSEGAPHRALGLLMPLFVGGAVGWLFLPALSVQTDGATSVAMSVMGALLAFGGLIVGFVVNLMLVTGKVEHPDGMSYELMQGVASRLKFLLSSQATTLFSALVMSALSIAWMLCRACNGSEASLHILGSVLAGFTALTFLRMFLLPLQIFEMHESSLNDGLKKKMDETNAKILAEAVDRD